MMKYLLPIALFVASPAHAVAVATFTEAPDVVSAKLASRCIDKGRTVEMATPTMVVCTKQMTTGEGFRLTLTMGASMTPLPIVEDRYIILPNANGCRVQATTQIKGQRKNGMPFTIPDSNGQADGVFKAMLREIGATD